MKSTVQVIHSITSVPALKLATCRKTLPLTEKTKHDCQVFGYTSYSYLHLLSLLFLATVVEESSLSVDFTTATAHCSTCWQIQSSGVLRACCRRQKSAIQKKTWKLEGWAPVMMLPTRMMCDCNGSKRRVEFCSASILFVFSDRSQFCCCFGVISLWLCLSRQRTD